MPDILTSLNIATLSQLVASFSFLILTVFSLAGLNKKTTGKLLLLASLASLAWSLALLFQAQSTLISLPLRFSLEFIKNGLWWLLLIRILGLNLKDIRTAPFSILSIILFSTGFIFFFVITNLWTDGLLMNTSKSIFSGQILLGMSGLILIEQILRNTRANRLFHIKYICIGLGIFFAYDLLLYAHAILFNQINYDIWNARGLVNALAVPFIILGSNRNTETPMRFNLSGDFVFYTGTAFFAGIYLLTMSGIGYFIKVFGGAWGGSLSIFFIALVLTTLTVLLFSGKIRTNVKVFISRHLFNYKYDYREEWIRITRTLSSTDEHSSLGYRSITALADIVGSNGGALWISDRVNGFQFYSTSLLPKPDFYTEPFDSPFSQFLLNKHWVIDLYELKENKNLYEYLQIPPWLESLGDEAWLVAPLVYSQSVYGFIVLNKPFAKISLGAEDHDLIKIAGSQIASELVLQHTMEELSKAKQFDAFNQMSAFIVHDIKTLISQLSLMVKNAEKHKENPDFIEDMIKTTDHSVKKMSGLLEKLNKDGLDEKLELINLSETLQKIVNERCTMKPEPIFLSCNEIQQVKADKDEIVSVFNHLIQNAQDATLPDGSIEVALFKHYNDARITIKDTGAGMSQEFIEKHLFQPFKSSKGVAGMGIGVYQCKKYITKIGGRINVQSNPGSGTEFVIEIPLFK